METIFAIATARGRAGVSIIRISGPEAQAACLLLAGIVPPPRVASLRKLRDRDETLLDAALVLFFESGASFTGEDIIELHLHGSVATTNRVIEVLGQVPGLRLAEPGEFTRRALENGCLDLSQVEGLADLIDAETEAQRRQAMRVFDGALGRNVDAWRANLIRAAALLEATIDFTDEDVPVDVTPEVNGLLASVMADLESESTGAQFAERIRDGFEVAIVGPPNIGKSTLLNALAGREAAITSSVAGTTRDVIEVRMDLSGLPVTFLDTAGLRETEDLVESIGVERARSRAAGADLRVYLIENPSDALMLEVGPDDVVLVGKSDLLPDSLEGVSGLTGAGLSKLTEDIRHKLSARASGGSVLIRERHRIAIDKAISALKNCKKELDIGMDHAELAAEELRIAIRALESMVGRIDVESILDEIFASFCLGK